MFRHIILAGVLFILVMVVVGSGVQACTPYASVYAETDWDLPIWSDTYDPCDGWLTWKVNFHRNGQENGYKIISFEVQGSDVYRTFDSRDYEEGDHSISESVYFGSSDEHRIFMDRTTSPYIHFTNIKGSVKRSYNTTPGN